MLRMTTGLFLATTGDILKMTKRGLWFVVCSLWFVVCGLWCVFGCSFSSRRRINCRLSDTYCRFTVRFCSGGPINCWISGPGERYHGFLMVPAAARQSYSRFNNARSTGTIADCRFTIAGLAAWQPHQRYPGNRQAFTIDHLPFTSHRLHF